MNERDRDKMQKLYGHKDKSGQKGNSSKERVTLYGTVSTPTPCQIQRLLEEAAEKQK